MGSRLFVDPERVEEPYGQTISFIAGLLDEDESAIGERLVSRIIRNRTAADQGERISRYLRFGGVLSDAQADAVRATDLKGINLEQAPVREVASPIDSIAAIVGKVGPGADGNPTGKLGAERWFDERLLPTRGRLESVRDASGRGMWVEPNGYHRASHGSSVRLTIDSALQRIAHEELVRGVEAANAAAGRIIMVDPSTGEVLAMIDHVADPSTLRHLSSDPTKSDPDAEYPRLKTIPDDPGRSVHPALGRNLCLQAVYEPGSTMKPFVWAAVTERRQAEPTEMFELNHGVWRTDFGRRIVDVFPKPKLTWSDVLVHSSNVGMAKGALRLTGAQLRADLTRFGFGRPTGLGLPGESGGIMTSRAKWTHWTQTSVSSGYEIAVTPVQMARAFCAFAREDDLAGTLPRLTLLADNVAPEDVQVRVIPAWVAMEARLAMVQVGERMEQKARGLYPDEPPYEHGMFAKSGTSEIANPTQPGYLDDQHHSSFLAAAPARHPRVVIIVVIDDAAPELVEERRHFGSAVAGPVVRRVLRRTFEYWGIPAPLQTDGAAG
jgi:cell division protein FtsI (penicillin-binding protein 3)